MITIIPNYHPMLVHFTIALTTTAFGTLLLSYLLRPFKQWRTECLVVSRWCLWLAAIASIFTIAAGFQAYFTVAHDSISHHVMTIHRNWALSTFTLVWLMAIWSWILWYKNKQPKLLFLFGTEVS